MDVIENRGGLKKWLGEDGTLSARKPFSVRFDDSSHCPAGPPGLPDHRWVHLAAGRWRYAGHSRAGNAYNSSRARIVGRRICLGAPPDGAHQARRRALERRCPWPVEGIALWGLRVYIFPSLSGTRQLQTINRSNQNIRLTLTKRQPVPCITGRKQGANNESRRFRALGKCFLADAALLLSGRLAHARACQSWQRLSALRPATTDAAPPDSGVQGNGAFPFGDSRTSETAIDCPGIKRTFPRETCRVARHNQARFQPIGPPPRSSARTRNHSEECASGRFLGAYPTVLGFLAS